MEKLKENARLLRQNSKKGISLVIAMCASALILGLSLYVIRAGGALLHQTAGCIEEERCGQLARSFAGVLERELCRGGREDGSFYALACEALKTGERVRCTAEGTAGYGILTVVIRPSEQDKEPVTGNGRFAWEDSPEMVVQISRGNSFFAGGFTVSVAAELDKERYVCSSAYHVYHCAQTGYFRNGEEQIFWDGTQWYADEEYTISVEENTGEIYWYYDDAMVEETIIVPLREEGGAL